MTRRTFLSVATGGMAGAISQEPLIAPIQIVLDVPAKMGSEQTRLFWSSIWPEAVRDFGRCGVHFQTSQREGRVFRRARKDPVIVGLDPGVINLVLTGRIPLEWDRGRALSGVTTLYGGCHLCMVALNRAHCHQIPLLSVNTCVHELLHALMLDIFENRPAGWLGQSRELRIDWYATRLWLFRDGADIRRSAQVYLQRLRSDLGPRS